MHEVHVEHPETLSQGEFARLINRKPGYISQLKSASVLVMTPDGRRVRVRESLAAIDAHRNPAFDGVAARHESERQAKAAPASLPEPPAGVDDSAQSQQANRLFKVSRAKKEHWAQQMAQLEFERKAGLVLYSAEVAAQANALATAVRVALEQMIDAVAPAVAATSDERRVRDLLADEIQNTLEALSRGLSGMARTEASA